MFLVQADFYFLSYVMLRFSRLQFLFYVLE